MSAFVDLLPWLSGHVPVPAAIVLLTVLVRTALLPLAVAAARGQRARARLAPQVAAVRKKYARDPDRLRRAVLDLHARERVSPLAGCLPGLLQLPVFFLLYHLFTRDEFSGHALFGASLGGRWTDALAQGGPLGPAGLVYLALFALVAAVATYTCRATRAQTAALGAEPAAPGMGALLGVMSLMPFATLVTVAVVPLAAALYVVTSTTWSAAERAVLHRPERPGG
ncbi:membrane protein insertase YidC [Streptomyces somaliensis]|uniref:membrane protein insertase YidC n=1 Tax=Streptomyces somaliensis TaxID=78355 RepID=UPI0020CCB007|nr:membrane protein insertase YidC [Streptomyces somaliensis]MCP9945714.1 membrane protein insertase YidC [Streptomyces somaliensis]MCP9961109.1 membrane protein insertase YidC [Streptomyces somaliensis]MCP9973903.1 membrane protein insertase YidC [Streptomyces somaliensis]